jgi:hypothetical protein
LEIGEVETVGAVVTFSTGYILPIGSGLLGIFGVGLGGGKNKGPFTPHAQRKKNKK